MEMKNVSKKQQPDKKKPENSRTLSMGPQDSEKIIVCQKKKVCNYLVSVIQFFSINLLSHIKALR